MAQVYAVMHNGKGEFLIAFKNILGYFFHKPGGGQDGTIIPGGQELNGAHDWALPGGKLEESNAILGALKEFLEETGVGLDTRQAFPSAFRGSGYYGVYFNVGSDFQPLLSAAQLNLEQGIKAANAVKNKEYGIGQYIELMDEFPGCPADNELSSAYPWNLREQIDEINMLKLNPATDWFFEILKNLAFETYGIIVTDPAGMLAGIGSTFSVTSSQVIIADFTPSQTRLLPQGTYTIITRTNTFRHMSFVSCINDEGIFKSN